eukprot:6086786-Pyramimonas_sp.AAC.1
MLDERLLGKWALQQFLTHEKGSQSPQARSIARYCSTVPHTIRARHSHESPLRRKVSLAAAAGVVMEVERKCESV